MDIHSVNKLLYETIAADVKDELTRLNKAIEKDPENTDLQEKRAKFIANMKKYKLAVESFNPADTLYTKHDYPINKKVKKAQSKYDKAKERYSKNKTDDNKLKLDQAKADLDNYKFNSNLDEACNKINNK